MIIMHNKVYNIYIWTTFKYIKMYLAKGFKPLSYNDLTLSK